MCSCLRWSELLLALKNVSSLLLFSLFSSFHSSSSVSLLSHPKIVIRYPLYSCKLLHNVRLFLAVVVVVFVLFHHLHDCIPFLFSLFIFLSFWGTNRCFCWLLLQIMFLDLCQAFLLLY